MALTEKELELEQTRKKLRLLLRFIEKESTGIVYTNFEDQVMGVTENTDAYRFGPTSDLSLYHRRVEEYVRSHMDDLTIQRLHRNQPITNLDLEQLDKKLFEASGMDTLEQYDKTIHPDKPLGVFIRELVGLDRNAAKAAFADYLDENQFNSQQIQFVNTIIDYLTSNGVMEASQLAQPPFTDFHDEGVFGMFVEDKIVEIRRKLKDLQKNAISNKAAS